MDYIYDVDELIATPPYRLGTDESKMQCHAYMIPATPSKLRQIVNDRLNAALGFVRGTHSDDDPPFGSVMHKTSTDRPGAPRRMRYLVPEWVNKVSLSFYRYWYADSLTNNAPQNQGWMQYTEVIVRFIVQRQYEGFDAEQEGLEFPITIYIDDSGWKLPATDPQAAPIVLGREAYGLPKAPGEIYYCTSEMDNPGYVHLKIWDNPSDNQIIRLADAIISDPAGTGEPAEAECEMPGDPVNGLPLNDPQRFSKLEQILSTPGRPFLIEPDTLRAPSRAFRDLLSRADAARARVMPIEGFPALVLYPELHTLFKLVALKQFPDPTTPLVIPADPNVPVKIEACYQAFVESAIEAPEDGVDGGTSNERRTVRFVPGLHRLKLKDWLGIGADEVTIDGTGIIWSKGRFVFGNPSRTSVFEPTGS